MTNIIFIADILLISIAFIWLVAASITDLKKREVPNWLSFSLIAIAFIIRILASAITKQSFYMLSALIAFAIFFALSNLFYYTRIFGGGDAKLLMALSIVFATAPSFMTNINLMQITQESFLGLNFSEPFLLIFLINIFVLGSLYGLVFSVFSSIKNRKSFVGEFKKTHQKRKIKIFSLFCWLIALCFLVLSFFGLFNLFGFIDFNWFFFVFIIFLFFPYVYIFVKAAENSAMIRKIHPDQLTEGDWILKPIRIKNRIIKPTVHGLNKKEIMMLKKLKKPVIVKYGLPFVPIFLASLILSLFVGDLLILLIQLFI